MLTDFIKKLLGDKKSEKFFAVLNKNQLIMLGITLAIIVSAYLNYTYLPLNSRQVTTNSEKTANNKGNVIGEAVFVDNSKSPQPATEVSAKVEANYFTQARIDREKMYSQKIEMMNDIISNSQIDSEVKKKTSQDLSALNDKITQGLVAETLIKAKDFTDVVILFNSDSINVIVKSDKALASNQVAQIQSIVARELKVKIENIHIITKS